MKLFKYLKKITAICVITAAVLTAVVFVCPKEVSAGRMDLVYIQFSLDGGTPFTVPAYEGSYPGNLFVSMRELSKALSGTVFQYGFYNDADGVFHIDTGIPYDASLEPEEQKDENDEVIKYEKPQIGYQFRLANWTLFNGRDVNYYTYADYGDEDMYMSTLDIQMLFDVKIEYANGVYNILSGEKFSVDLNELDANGHFDYLHSVLLGDATTGEIIYANNEDIPVPIASTTKLMTYLLVERMIEIGKISPDDMVTISADAARISTSDDAVIYMYEGLQTTVDELLKAMIIQSSNESAQALGEYVAGGSSEKFVEMMNDMAFRLGLETAVFYNSHGLPTFTAGSVVTMVENKMSARDMFKLARTILLKYPQIEEISSLKSAWLDILWTNVVTNNSLMYNMDDVFGMKTGTTDAAGKCLVAARRVQIEGEEHILVAMVFGAEENIDRFGIPELLLKSQGY
ncbi:MAG: D-alanyl-D-alanine carboxypeptidase [Parasporobacterium sp.]|nr:D-alanyl-D-alanine carboxypeptidase [Parasporobacterium sp.]